MTDPNDADDPAEAADTELLALLTAALTDAGELLPTDEAEVLRAEAQGVEDIELPASLAMPPQRDRTSATEQQPEHEVASVRHGDALDLNAYRERRQQQDKPPATRFNWLSHGLTAVLGAAAAALLLLYWGPERVTTSPAGDPAGSSSAPAPPKQVTVNLDPAKCAEGCCAGADCKKAEQELTACSSSRRCIACDTKELAKSHYRVRTGALFTAASGDDALNKYPTGELELCARAGASREVCIDAHLNDRKTPYLSRLPLLVSGEDLGGVLQMRLHWKGVSGELGTPARIVTPIMITPKSLCRGHRINFKTASGEIFANMSLFLDDTHYVELRRAADPNTLLDYQRSIIWNGVEAQVQQTRSVAADEFVLTLGPFDKPTAERLRWQLLQQRQSATTTVGADYIGDSLTVP